MKFNGQARPNRTGRVLYFLVSGVISAGMGPALSAAAADAPSSSPDDSNKLEQIVATAERRSTDLQLSAIAATVLTGEELDKLNVKTVDSLMFNTPSFTLPTSRYNAFLNIPAIAQTNAAPPHSPADS